MFAATYNLTVDRASTWSMVLTLQDPSGAAIDYSTAANFTGQVRPTYTDAVAATFVFTAPTVGSPALGQVSMTLPVAQTELLKPGSSYEYDVFLTLGGITTKLLQGALECRPNITR
jgi:hypothetical protein